MPKKHVYISRHVMFLEHVFPYKDLASKIQVVPPSPVVSPLSVMPVISPSNIVNLPTLLEDSVSTSSSPPLPLVLSNTNNASSTLFSPPVAPESIEVCFLNP